MPKNRLKECQKNRDVSIWAITRGPECVRQYRKRELLRHLERRRWFKGCRGVGGDRRGLTLGVEGLHITAPPTLVAVDLHPFVCLSLLRKFHFACGCNGSRVLSEGTGASQDTLRPAVLEKGDD